MFQTPLDERHHLLQRYQDFPRGLLYGTLQLVYSSLEEDPSRICMFMYRPNENPPEHGKLHMLTTYNSQKEQPRFIGTGVCKSHFKINAPSTYFSAFTTIFCIVI
ncbi:unnamed protein product [Ixodes persulcatus]